MREVKPILAMYGFRGKQAYIYKTNRIKEVIGASKIIEDGFEYLYDAADMLGYKIGRKEIAGVGQEKKEEIKITGKKSCNRKKNKKEQFDIDKLFITEEDGDGIEIYEGGGNLYILYRNKQIAIEINKKFTKKLIEATYSLRASCAFIDLTKDEEGRDIGEGWRRRNFKDDRRKLIKEYERIENQELPLEVYSTLPFVQIDSRTSQPYEYKKQLGGNTEKLSRESYLKIEKYNMEQNSKNKKILYYSNLLDQYVTQKGKESLLAIIYIDGNNMGNKVNGCLNEQVDGSNYNCCIEALRKFSSEINRVYIKEGLNQVEKELDTLRERDKNKRLERRETKGKEVDYQFGYRKIIAAGDEITIICNVRAAFKIVKAYLKKLPSNYSSCAGIAIFHSHDPYSNAYKIAEECCESAKKISHKYANEDCCVVDFHFCHAGINTSLDIIRERDEVVISRPWIVKKKNNNNVLTDVITIETVEKMVKQLSNISRSNRMALTEAAIKGKREFEYELERILANSDAEEEINLEEIKLDNDKKRQLIYDIGLVYDVWFSEEE